MKCPLREVPAFDGKGDVHFEQADCLEGECAWWSDDLDQCDPTGLLPWLKKLVDLMEVKR